VVTGRLAGNLALSNPRTCIRHRYAESENQVMRRIQLRPVQVGQRCGQRFRAAHTPRNSSTGRTAYRRGQIRAWMEDQALTYRASPQASRIAGFQESH